MTTAATVVSLSGEAFARSADGSMRRLSAGDKIQQGEVVITSAGAQVNLLTADGQTMAVGGQESLQFGPESTQATAPGAAEAAVAGAPGEIDVAQLLEQEAAAAGLGAGGENGGNSFVRLLRITEELTPLSYEFPNPAEGEILPAFGLEGLNVPSAGDLAIALDEDDIHYRKGSDLHETAWFSAFVSSVGWPGSHYDNGNNDLALGDDLPRNSPTRMEGTLNFSYGGDGVGDIAFNLPTLALTSGELEVQYWLSADGHTLVGYVRLGYEPEPGNDSYEVFRMQDGSYVKVIFAGEITNVDTGGFAFTLYGPLDHAEAGIEDNLVIPFGFTVTDGTGDTALGTLTVNVDDDMPVATCHPTQWALLEEESVPWLHGNDEFDFLSFTTGNESILNSVRWGADGFGGVASVTVGGETFAANEYGWTYVFFDENGDVFTGGEKAVPAVVLAFDAEGNYRLTVIGPMDHPAMCGENLAALPVITFNAQDGDGDPIGVQLIAAVQDDVPWAVPDFGLVREGATLTVAAAHGVLANDLPGADDDDDASVFSAGTSPWDGKPLGGDGEITLAGKYGTLTLHADGSYEYQAEPNAIKHDAIDTFYYTIRDGDGDLSTTALNIYVDDVTLKAHAWNDSKDNGVFDYSKDNRTETFTVDIDPWQNTGDGGKWGGKFSLPEGEDFTDDHKLGNYQLKPITIQHDAEITFTFQSEGAGFQNAVGWYEMDKYGNPTVGHVVWSNASAEGSGGSLETGDTATATVEAGMKIGFFMIPDAYYSGLPSTVYFHNGHAYADAGHTQLINSDDNKPYSDTDPVWFSNSTNLDGVQHVIAGTANDNPSNVLNVAFEDLGGGGDKDYNDVVFTVDLGKGNDVSFNEVVFNLGVDLPDVALKSATVDFSLGDGDTVTWNTTLAADKGLTVTVDKSGDVTITADDQTNGSLAIEDLLDTFRINVGYTGAGEDYTKVDADQRTATVSVMDIYGNESNDVTAVFNMIVKTDPNPT